MQMESVGQELCGSDLSLLRNICEMEDLKFGDWNHLKPLTSLAVDINHSLWTSVSLYVVSLNGLILASSYNGGWVIRESTLQENWITAQLLFMT